MPVGEAPARPGMTVRKPDPEDLEKANILLALLFAFQLGLIQDKSKRKALVCPRRAGKTFAIVIYMLVVCLTCPRSNVVYVTITKEMGRSLIWDHPGHDSLKSLNREHDLGMKFNDTIKFARFKNGSRLAIMGLDKRKDIEKLLGGKYNLVVIDECASIPNHMLRDVVERAIGPALNDYGGTLLLAGTPANIPTGLFYESCPWTLLEDNEPGWDPDVLAYRPYHERRRKRWRGRPFVWSSHRWEVKDNIKQPQIWEAVLRDKEAYEWSDLDPTFLRQHRGICVVDPSSRVFSGYARRHLWEPKLDKYGRPILPVEHEWTFMRGAFISLRGEFAITVAACSETCGILYHCETFRSSGLFVEDFGRELQRLERKYGRFASSVGYREGGTRAIVNALDERFDAGFSKADHREQDDLIELLRSDFDQDRVVIRKGSPLDEEIENLHRTKDRESFLDTCSIVALNSFLYIWPESTHLIAELPKSGPEPGTEEYYRQEARDAFEKAVARRRGSELVWEDGGTLFFQEEEDE